MAVDITFKAGKNYKWLPIFSPFLGEYNFFVCIFNVYMSIK